MAKPDLKSTDRPTLVDIAKNAGVCLATVSRTLGHAKVTSVSPKTRKRVLAAVDRLGYQPDWLARAHRKGRSYNLAIADLYDQPIEMSATLDPHGYDRIMGMSAAAAKRHYRIIPLCLQEPDTVGDQLLAMAGSRVFDGIYIGHDVPDRNNLVRKLAAEGTSVVTPHWHDPLPSRVAMLEYDVAPPMLAAMNYVREQDLFPVLNVSRTTPGLPQNEDSHEYQRHQACDQFCGQHAIDRQLVHHLSIPSKNVPHLKELLPETLAPFLAKHGYPRSVIGVDEYVAAAVREVFEAQGVKVPTQTTFIGGSDARGRMCLLPVHTYIRPYLFSEASRIVDLLIDMIDEPDMPRDKRFIWTSPQVEVKEESVF